MFKRVGRWHGLRLTDVPAAANLLRQRTSDPISFRQVFSFHAAAQLPLIHHPALNRV
jgi:hypothetical protein